MKVFVIAFWIALLSLTASAEEKFTSNCHLDNIAASPQNYFQELHTPETDAFTGATGISFYELKQTYSYSGDGFSYNLIPSSNTTERNSFAKRLTNVLMTYPKSFMQRQQRVCFLLVDKIGADGTYGLTPDSIVILSTIATNSIINHEFFHAMDHLYAGAADINAFRTLNPTGTSYIGQSRGSVTVGGSRFRQITEAFVSPYASCTVDEDRAETFAGMTLDYNQFNTMAVAKPAIKNKINNIKKFISDLSEISDQPVMNETYWSEREPDLADGNYESCLRRNSADDCKNSKHSFRPYSDW